MPNPAPTTCARLASCFLCALAFPSTAPAGSVVPMNLPRMSDEAALVFIGRVTSVQPRWADNPRRIESDVVFQYIESLKGNLPVPRDTFTLTVPGGEVGTMRMRLCCAPAFQPGDKWLLFILPEYRTHPVVGLWQGALRIVEDPAGIDRVCTAAMQPIGDVDDDGFLRAAGDPTQSLHDRLLDSQGVHLLLPPARAEQPEPMTLDSFLDTLRPILDHSRPHPPGGPVGRYRPPPHTVAPLRAAPSARPPARPLPAFRPGTAPRQRPEIGARP